MGYLGDKKNIWDAGFLLFVLREKNEKERLACPFCFVPALLESFLIQKILLRNEAFYTYVLYKIA
jgi:hypothetical protein